MFQKTGYRLLKTGILPGIFSTKFLCDDYMQVLDCNIWKMFHFVFACNFLILKLECKQSKKT